MPGLESLDLSYCKLFSLDDDLGKMVSLKNLNLEGNALISFPSSMANLKALRSLNLKMNRQSNGLIPGGIENANTLEDAVNVIPIDLQKLFYLLANLPEFQSLNLADCYISELPSDIRNLHSLKNS